MKKRYVRTVACMAVLFMVALPFLTPPQAKAAASDWPRRTLEIIAPFRAGGDTDFYARTYAKYLEKELGVSVTVVNVEGAGGVVGSQQIISARPDGYRVLFTNTGAMFAVKLTGVSDIDHNSYALSCIGIRDDTNVLVAGKDAGFADAKDFLAKAKAAPGKYSVATTVPGFSFFTICKLQAAGNFTINPADFGGAAAMTSAIIGNQVPLAVNSYGVFKQYVENGDIIPLMVCSEKRNPNFPNVPTVGELGMPEGVAPRVYFFGFPKKTDDAIIKKLSDAVGRIQNNPDFVADINKAYSVQPFYRDTATAQQYMNDLWNDMAKYKDAMTTKK